MIDDAMIVERVNNLSNVLKSTPVIKTQEQYDPSSEGEDSDLRYDGDGLYGRITNICPHFINDRWAFEGEFDDLLSLAKEIRLRDAEDNGKIILPEEGSLTNAYCKFWNHIDLWKTKIIVENRHALNPKKAIDRLFMRVLKGDPTMENGDGKRRSKSMTEGTQLSFTSVGAKKQASYDVGKKLVDASTLLGAMNFDKQKLIAGILDLTGFKDEVEDPRTLFSQLLTGAVQNTQKAKQFGDVAWQDKFIELAKLSNEKLTAMYRIVQAKRKGGIRQRSGSFLFMGEKIQGVRNIKELIDYYLDPHNDSELSELEDWIEAN